MHANAQDSKLRFLVFGDSQGTSASNLVNLEILTELAREMTNQRPAFVLIPGDLSHQGDMGAYQAWSNAMSPVYETGIGVYPIRGNHDAHYINGAPAEAFQQFFGASLPQNGPVGETGLTYSFVHSNVLIVALDMYVTANQVNVNWLKGVLATNTALHVFAMGHEPAFKVQHDDCMAFYPEKRDAFWNVLTKAACRVYFSGHDHFYDHARIDDGDGDPSNDTHQLVMGTGGGPLYDDGAYDGLNSGWTPTRVYHEKQHGYAIVEIEGAKATITWHHRTGPNSYEATSEAFSYNLEPVIVPKYANGALTLTWSGGGALESAPSQDGPWSMVDKGTSPCVITNLSRPQELFRVKLR